MIARGLSLAGQRRPRCLQSEAQEFLIKHELQVEDGVEGDLRVLFILQAVGALEEQRNRPADVMKRARQVKGGRRYAAPSREETGIGPAGKPTARYRAMSRAAKRASISLCS